MDNNNDVCPTPKGVLLVIGGKENKGQEEGKNTTDEQSSKEEVLQTFLSLTGKQDPVVEVITTASSMGDESFEEYKTVFQRHLAGARVYHLHHESRSDMNGEEVEERIKTADAVFFSGGDQLRLSSIYGGTPFLTILKNRYINDPIVIAGTSAGAMALSTPMIYAAGDENEQIAGEIKVTTGLEFLKDVCIDTHFVNRGRFVRMAQVIATNPTSIGIGIEEDTAIIVRNGRDAEVLGSGIIIILEGFEISDANMDNFTEKKPLSIRDLRVHLLSSGNKYEIPKINPPHN